MLQALGLFIGERPGRTQCEMCSRVCVFDVCVKVCVAVSVRPVTSGLRRLCLVGAVTTVVCV